MYSESYLPLGESRLMTNMMLGDCFCTVTPTARTSCGNCGVAMATRFWTSTCATSRFVPSAKVIVSVIVPSLALWLFM